MDGVALPPKWAFTLKPLKIGGLWLAVITTPPANLRRWTSKET